MYFPFLSLSDSRHSRQKILWLSPVQIAVDFEALGSQPRPQRYTSGYSSEGDVSNRKANTITDSKE